VALGSSPLSPSWRVGAQVGELAGGDLELAIEAAEVRLGRGSDHRSVQRNPTLTWRTVCQARAVHWSSGVRWIGGVGLAWGGVGRVLGVGESHMQWFAFHARGDSLTESHERGGGSRRLRYRPRLCRESTGNRAWRSDSVDVCVFADRRIRVAPGGVGAAGGGWQAALVVVRQVRFRSRGSLSRGGAAGGVGVARHGAHWEERGVKAGMVGPGLAGWR